MRFPIFAKILSGFSILLLLMLAGQSYSLFTLKSATTRYAALFGGNQELLDSIRSMQVDFKRQVQEWKNILLRGHEAADFETYQLAFLQKYEEIQQQAAGIQKLELSQQSRTLLQQFIIEHQRLQTDYLEALQILKADGTHNADRADRSVRGQDRPATELLDTLSLRIQQDAQARGDILQQQTARAQKLLLGILALLCALFLLIALLLARKFSLPLKEIRDILQEVAEGNAEVECSLRSKDEIGDLAALVRDTIAYMQQIASVLKDVADGKQEIEVHPKSEHDLLNHSLMSMLANLHDMRTAVQHSIMQTEEQYQAIKAQNWSKDGLSRLSASLSGAYSIEESCRIAIQALARYVNAGQGVVYMYEADQKELILQASFAFSERAGLSRRYALGENIIGQVAQERKAILLKHTEGKERLINSALISQAPLNTYALPLVYNNDLFGVMELASFEAFGEKEQEFLTQAAIIIATAVFSAQQRARSEGLLRQADQALQTAEDAEEKAQERSREAQKANARLEEQQQRLQQQNEEFHQMTQQLKEQQQQLLQENEERLKLQRSLEQERRLLRKLIDNLPDYIYAKDRHSRFILVNQTLAHSCGFSNSEEMLGKTDYDIHPKALADTFHQAEQRLMQSGEELRDREEVVEDNNTGEQISLLTSKILFQDRHGKVAGFIGIGRNITARKRTEKALQELQTQFERRLEERSADLLQKTEESASRVKDLEVT